MPVEVDTIDFIPTRDVKRRLVHQDDFKFVASGDQYHVGARPRKSPVIQLMWVISPLLIAMGLYWVIDGVVEVKDEQVWMLWAFLAISIVTGGALFVGLQFVYRSHAKIGKLLVGRNGWIEVLRSGDQIALDDIESVVLLRGTLCMPHTTVHHQNYPICQVVMLLKSQDDPVLVFTALHYGRSLERALEKFCRHGRIQFRVASATRYASVQAIPPPGK